MWQNYLKIALRNTKRHKGYTFLNVAGLAIGIAACLFIAFFIKNELSYDNYHQDVERLYRVAIDIKASADNRVFAQTSGTLAPALKKDFSEVEAAARLWKQDNKLVKYGEEKAFYENNFYLTDPEIFDVFTIPLIRGNAQTALNRPATLLIAEETARKYFGEEDPIGKTLRINERDYEVSGVMKSLPERSHLKLNLVTSFATIEQEEWYEDAVENWFATMFYTYIKVKEHVEISAFEKKVASIANAYEGERLKEFGYTFRYFLQPVQDIHLYSNLRYEAEAPGNPINIYIFTVVAMLILLIASLNYVNLTTAQSAKRAKEVGVRKVLGAAKSSLFVQFLFETIILTAVALVLALLIVFVSRPLFETISGQAISLQQIFTPGFVASMLGLTLVVGVVAAVYPALFLASYKPVRVLKGSLSKGSGGASLRKVLVVCQFSISLMLIVGTIIVYRQLNFMKNQQLGFEKEQVLVLPVRGASIADNNEQIKNEFQSHSSIISVASSASIPGEEMDNFSTSLMGVADDKSQSMFYLFVDADFLKTYGIEMVAGRPFNEEIRSDAESGFLINEKAVAAFGWANPEEAIGQKLSAGFGRDGEIIGVYKDFHYRSLQASIEPLVMAINPNRFSYISLHLKTNDMASTMAFVEQKWKELFPQMPYEYAFLDEEFNKQYAADEKMGQTFLVFTSIAIFIACLGLFGLATFIAQQRTKEIGVRKVLGASVSSIVALLSKDFVKLILVSFVIATPLSYLLISKWLENFAMRISIGWPTFAVAGITILLIALLTVSFQSLKAALANPVRNLRSE
ncbi:ABC transporter permease [Cesiribacter sp. SM1]|uniref:ABC transporter permease n=1 Tax=Cesiribacter sp. SM1 TaxID=2861196 RepID=UPI001CD5B1A1|nr:ABC transporter permease [Cesiribacter sp. SM1]